VRARDERAETPRRVAEPEPAPEPALLLQLQRTAGNHAVTALLQRAPGSRERTRRRGRERDAKVHNLTEPEEGSSERDIELAGEYDEDYEAALREFAEATDEMDFSGTGTQPRFDEECWTCVVIGTLHGGQKRRYSDIPALVKQWEAFMDATEDVELEYTLKPGVRPSFAIREIQAHPDRWALDCIDYVVAAKLYAECVAGSDLTFDLKYTNVGTRLKPRRLKMAQHKTAKLTASDFWRRKGQGLEFKSKTSGQMTGFAPANARREDEFLASVPIGARVMWTTTHPDAADDMVNENTIKIGDDLYAAHPLGNLSGAKVRDEMVAEDDDELTPEQRLAQVVEHIYLAEVEWYDRH
jgi:hypothetical protein